VNRFSKVVTLVAVLLFCFAPALLAADQTQEEQQKELAKAAVKAVSEAQQLLGREGFSIYLGRAFGAGLVILGAAYGISRIGANSVESIARQPEVANNIQTTMIISAALIEGATFFALIVCWFAAT
jgi:F-type H+-transporting ATPase subunit c